MHYIIIFIVLLIVYLAQIVIVICELNSYYSLIKSKKMFWLNMIPYYFLIPAVREIINILKTLRKHYDNLE